MGRHRSDFWIQPVAATFCNQQGCIGRVRLNLLPQAVDVRLQRMRGDGSIIAPNFIQQHLTGHRARASAVKKLEDGCFFFRQTNATVFLRFLKQLGRRAERIWPDAEHGVFTVFKQAHLARRRASSSAIRKGLAT